MEEQILFFKKQIDKFQFLEGWDNQFLYQEVTKT